MPGDPMEIERARERLTQLEYFQQAANRRAGTPPRIEEDAWRGPAYAMYLLRADGVASGLRRWAIEVGDAVVLAGEELDRVL